MHLTSDLIIEVNFDVSCHVRGVTSLDRSYLVVFNYVGAFGLWTDKEGLTFGGSGNIREELLYGIQLELVVSNLTDQ